MSLSAWIFAVAGCLLGIVGTSAFGMWRAKARRTLAPLPEEWALTPRPVFNTEERRVYRLLREALPHHVILSKLPLVRFSQPVDPNDVRYWFDLLGSVHVAFAVCSANGRVLAAIDLESERSAARRQTQVKQQVMSACRVRYLRCTPGNLPTIAELQMLVPQAASTHRGLPPVPTAPESMSNAVANRRAERAEPMFQDSSLFQDSFFALDSRLDHLASEYGSLNSGHGGLHADRDARARDEDDIAGVVVDHPGDEARRRR